MQIQLSTLSRVVEIPQKSCNLCLKLALGCSEALSVKVTSVFQDHYLEDEILFLSIAKLFLFFVVVFVCLFLLLLNF